jgi:hypothetical protein
MLGNLIGVKLVGYVTKLITSFKTLSTLSKFNLIVAGMTAVYLITVKVTEQIDKLAYKWLGIDMSGMQKPTEELEKSMKKATEASKKLDNEVKKLGLKGIETWGDFEKLEKSELIKYDKTIGKWVDLRSELKITQEQITATTKGFSELAGMVDKMGGMNLKFASSDLPLSIKNYQMKLRPDLK